MSVHIGACCIYMWCIVYFILCPILHQQEQQISFSLLLIFPFSLPLASVHHVQEHLIILMILWGWQEFLLTISIFTVLPSLAGCYQLASATSVNNHAYMLPWRVACLFQLLLTSDVKVSCICDSRGWEPSRKAMLSDVFCHFFRLPEQAFVLVHLLGGLGVSDCNCCSCSLAASSSSWHMKLARPLLVYTWNAQATQPFESKLSVSQFRTLKRWPACWTELSCRPLLHWKWELEYMIYSLCFFYAFYLCVWEFYVSYLLWEVRNEATARVYIAVS